MNAIVNNPFFNVVARPSTYANIAYVWLAFPLGIAYFVLLTTESALSIGLSLRWIGLVVMLAFVLSLRGLGNFERLLAKWPCNDDGARAGEGAVSSRFGTDMAQLLSSDY